MKRNIFLLTVLALITAGAFGSGQTETRQVDSTSAVPDRQVQAYRVLSPEEHYILNEMGTERPFSGEYNNHYETGTYHCRQCGSPLYNSEAKFNSGTGWPSFDDAVPGAVTSVPDPRGIGTEIICSYCNGHLGHIFIGEGLTAKNTRHCVNSLALSFSPHKQAVFAGGCFWCIEYYFEELEGIIDAVSGYTGGTAAAPSYREVTSGRTGHVEAVKVTYDPEVISYRELARYFFEIHDPTQEDGQGLDIGDHYLSVLFYGSEEEKSAAQDLVDQLESRGYRVATTLRPRVIFWPAEDYHQDYYRKNNFLPYREITPRFE